MMADPRTEHFASFDGTEIAYRVLGEGRPLLLIHGLFSNADTNWIKWGNAQRIADAGFQLIMPDLRAHGLSAAPRDPAAYPADVLPRDIEALIAHLGLDDYDLGGYSLGGRTTVRLIVRGARPRRAVIAGMGLSGILDSRKRTDWFLEVIADRDRAERGTDKWMAVQFMKTTGVDPEAVALLLRSQVDTPREALSGLAMPTLVVCGAEDQDNGSAPDLAAALPNAKYREIPGNHMNAVMKPELGTAIAEFLVR